ncbi:MAG: hypothetical protein AAF363_10845 [Bacteroidota bacterium]
MLRSLAFGFVFYLLCIDGLEAQRSRKPLRIYLNEDSSSYAGFRIIGQFWLRFNQNNPGTLINDELRRNFNDFSIRRLRFQTFGTIRDRTRFFLAFGQNNINFETSRVGEIRLIDFYIDHKFTDYLQIGGGQSAWNGLSRFASPASSSMLGLDIPIVALPTVNISDNLLRKLSIFFKGQFSHWDYRLVLSRPFPVETNGSFDPTMIETSDFADLSPKLQTSAYLKYQFFEHESQASPFSVGTYHGTKKILAVGGGFEIQPDALWHFNAESDTVITNLELFAFDIFGEIPTRKNEAVSFYASYLNYDLGPNYIRLIGVNNVASGSNSQRSFNLGGNRYPTIGTGHTYYVSTGYLFSTEKFKQRLKLQPFLSAQISDFERLDDLVTFYETGFNYILDGQRSKFTFAIQNRPIFNEIADGSIRSISRRNAFIMQYQFRIE